MTDAEPTNWVQSAVEPRVAGVTCLAIGAGDTRRQAGETLIVSLVVIRLALAPVVAGVRHPLEGRVTAGTGRGGGTSLAGVVALETGRLGAVVEVARHAWTVSATGSGTVLGCLTARAAIGVTVAAGEACVVASATGGRTSVVVAHVAVAGVT